MADKLIIFDTTLRDGEQCAGASMTKDEKLRIARQLERPGRRHRGWVSRFNGDFDAVVAIANAIRTPALRPSRANDASRAPPSAQGCANGRSTPSCPSPPHGEKARMTPDELLSR
jgi:2-isopropylmalate synthase